MKKRYFIPVIFVILYACGNPAAPTAEGPGIVSFTFPAAENPELTEDVPAVISGTAVTAELPPGTDLTGLLPQFVLTGNTVSVPISGTINNFSRPAYYIVSFDDGSQSLTYTVTVSLSEE